VESGIIMDAEASRHPLGRGGRAKTMIERGLNVLNDGDGDPTPIGAIV
jgi:hypothetical protein